MNNISDRPNILITGGSRGIGRAIALQLAENNAGMIFINYLQNDSEAQLTQKLLSARNTQCILVRANILHLDEVDALFDTIKEYCARLDIFIHCAALGTFKPLSTIKPNQWDLTMNINSRAFLYMAQKSAAVMNKGRIIAISSLGSQRVIPNYGAMGPSKAALESLIRYLAVELAPRGIQVNGVSGGFIETDSIKKFPDSEKLIRKAIDKTPAKRIGKPEDIAGVVSFLTSPLSEFIYGQIIIADGGISLI